jgi:hypothetical protein
MPEPPQRQSSTQISAAKVPWCAHFSVRSKGTACPQVESRYPALWAGFHVVSIGFAIGTATLIAHLLEDRGAWPLGGFASTTIHLVVLAAQLALAS